MQESLRDTEEINYKLVQYQFIVLVPGETPTLFYFGICEVALCPYNKSTYLITLA